MFIIRDKENYYKSVFPSVFLIFKNKIFVLRSGLNVYHQVSEKRLRLTSKDVISSDHRFMFANTVIALSQSDKAAHFSGLSSTDTIDDYLNEFNEFIAKLGIEKVKNNGITHYAIKKPKNEKLIRLVCGKLIGKPLDKKNNDFLYISFNNILAIYRNWISNCGTTFYKVKNEEQLIQLKKLHKKSDEIIRKYSHLPLQKSGERIILQDSNVLSIKQYLDKDNNEI